MPPTTPTLLHDVAASILDSAAASLVLPPDRQYVSMGEPAWDCEQLAVWLDSLYPTSSETRFPSPSQRTRCNLELVGRFCVGLLRCVPTMEENGDPPRDDVLDASAEGLYEDLWRLYKGLLADWREKVLVPGIGCAEIAWQAAEPLGPQGGLAGWRICAVVTLNDTETPGS